MVGQAVVQPFQIAFLVLIKQPNTISVHALFFHTAVRLFNKTLIRLALPRNLICQAQVLYGYYFTEEVTVSFHRFMLCFSYSGSSVILVGNIPTNSISDIIFFAKRQGRCSRLINCFYILS